MLDNPDINQCPNIIGWLHRHGVKSGDSLRRLFGYCHGVKFNKRQIIIAEGGMKGSAYFIESGMTRSYWLVDGNEITTSFSTEGSIVFSMDELYYAQPSEEFVEAVDDVTAYAIALSDLRDAVAQDRELSGWWVRIHQDEYRRLHRSHKERLSLTAAERYEAFARQFPDVCRRARLVDIASYLGMTPSTLSKIRAQ